MARLIDLRHMSGVARDPDSTGTRRVPTVVAAPLAGDVADLGEGPHWLASGMLSWVDILTCRLLVGEPDVQAGDVRKVAEYVVDRHVGAALPLGGGREGWILAAGMGFAHLDGEGVLHPLAEPEGNSGGAVRMNDAGCDAAGRLWAGSMAYDEQPGAGSLFRVDLDGTVTRMLDGLQISNGIGWSPDGASMYLNDSGHGVVYRAAYDLDRGEIGPLAVFITPSGVGSPDGMTVDDEGMLWIAFWGGARVERYTPQGRLVARVQVAVPQPTSCCLGGADGRTLFITSAREGMSEEQLRESPHAGQVFAAAVDVPGSPVQPFLGDLPAAFEEAPRTAPRDHPTGPA